SPDKFVLIWKQAGTVISTIDVPRKDDVHVEGNLKVVRYPELASKIDSEWKTVGAHRDASDRKFDQAILHTDNETAYVFVIGVIANLSLTSMIDFLVVTVVFLLMTFSASAETPIAKGIQLPKAENTMDMIDAPIVGINGSEVLVDGTAAGNTRAIEDSKRMQR